MSGKNWKKTKKFQKPKSFRQSPWHLIHTSFSSFIHEKSKQSTLKPLIFANYPVGPIFNDFLWVCWFLCKNLSNFVYPVWKLHNPYCHTRHPLYPLGHLNEGFSFLCAQKWWVCFCCMCCMAIRVVEFSNGVYKIRKIFE